jgi:short-subunit dehydrogenase
MSQTIVITGASSGIGRSLALASAAPGVRLGLLGRDPGRLEQIAGECRAARAEVLTAAIDIRARDEIAAWLAVFDDAGPIDLLIANAGIMSGTPPGGEIEPAKHAFDLMQINVFGTLNTVQPLLPRMMARRRGQIAIISSIAAMIPLRDSPSYCASKSALLAYGLSLRDLLRAHGIGVSVVCPGYVTTAMSRQEIGDKPFEMPPERAAQIILKGLKRDKAVIAFPFWFALITRLGGLLPDRLRERVTRASRFSVEPAAR